MNESMLDRLKTMENRYEELGHMLMDPDIGSDIKKMTEVTKEQSSLQAAYDLYQEYKEVEAGISDAKELAKEIETVFLLTALDYRYFSSSRIRELIHFGADISPYVPQGVVKEVEKKCENKQKI